MKLDNVSITNIYKELKDMGITMDHIKQISEIYGSERVASDEYLESSRQLKGSPTDINTLFRGITQEMNELHARKNADYGDSFGMSLDEDGLVASKVRIGDKFRRFGQLIKNPAQVKEESLRDTLIDMAVYSIKTIIWMEQDRGFQKEKEHDDIFDALSYVIGRSPFGGSDFDGDIVNIRDAVAGLKVEMPRYVADEPEFVAEEDE